MSSSSPSQPSNSPKKEEQKVELALQEENQPQKNNELLTCPLCTSKILLEQKADSYFDGVSELPLPRQQRNVETQTESVKGFWVVKDMFTFENVGFTNAMSGRKFLTCADCDFGPIGYVDPETKLNYISPNRLEKCEP